MPSTEAVLAEIDDECERAWKKFPRPMVNFHEAYAVLLEEVDEFWDEVKADNPEKARRELVQVAAMAVRALVELG